MIDEYVIIVILVYTLKLSPHPHAPLEFGLVNVNSDDNSVSMKSISVLKLSTYHIKARKKTTTKKKKKNYRRIIERIIDMNSNK